MIKRIYIVVGLILVIILFFFSSYNSLIAKDESVKTQWSQVESVYQRRFDLIPNVVSTVKGAAKQELDVFKQISEARTRYAGARTTDERSAAAGELESSLARLLVIVENYPTLKSQESFLSLIAELEGTENRINVERQRYNEAVKIYNTATRKFPHNITARIFNFPSHQLFEARAEAQNAPKVEF